MHLTVLFGNYGSNIEKNNFFKNVKQKIIIKIRFVSGSRVGFRLSMSNPVSDDTSCRRKIQDRGYPSSHLRSGNFYFCFIIKIETLFVCCFCKLKQKLTIIKRRDFAITPAHNQRHSNLIKVFQHVTTSTGCPLQELFE